jgi:hypothetical protein
MKDNGINQWNISIYTWRVYAMNIQNKLFSIWSLLIKLPVQEILFFATTFFYKLLEKLSLILVTTFNRKKILQKIIFLVVCSFQIAKGYNLETFKIKRWNKIRVPFMWYCIKFLSGMVLLETFYAFLYIFL